MLPGALEVNLRRAFLSAGSVQRLLDFSVADKAKQENKDYNWVMKTFSCVFLFMFNIFYNAVSSTFPVWCWQFQFTHFFRTPQTEPSRLKSVGTAPTKASLSNGNNFLVKRGQNIFASWEPPPPPKKRIRHQTENLQVTRGNRNILKVQATKTKTERIT